jgi:hypothetical protein
MRSSRLHSVHYKAAQDACQPLPAYPRDGSGHSRPRLVLIFGGRIALPRGP